MDTVIPSISVSDLFARLGSPRWPVVLDVRRPPAYDRDEATLPAALRCLPDEVETFAASLAPGTEIVCSCVHGHEVSQGAASALRARRFDARYLEGGVEHWREAGLPLLRKHAAFGIPGKSASRWVTRERPKIDRIACPWLVRRFVDPRAEFGYLPTGEVLGAARGTGSIAYDIPGGAIEHDGELCSFDVMLREFGLRDPALDELARIVRGADTDRLDLAPQSAGLLAVSLGLGQLYADDRELLERGMGVYDALYAWCRHARGETHGWHPEAMREATR
jgi:rhodanese-related sulfurtransferase